ncbi:MAG: PilZ domain-containing protein [Desulfurivibrionaceae bacterium]
MMKERRRHKRFHPALEAELTLYDTETCQHLTYPTGVGIYDISRSGAALELPEVIKQGRHLFFAPQESDNLKFYLTVHYFRDERIENVELLAKPAWFNRDMDSQKRFFTIGIEFEEKLDRQVLDRLNS